jgi:hypothetical protein
MKTRISLIVLSILLLVNTINAQSNFSEPQLGLYFGYRGGIALIKPMAQTTALEILLTFEHTGLGIGVNKLYMKPFAAADPNLNFVLGFGAFIRNSWDHRYFMDKNYNYWDNSMIGIGADLVLGLDYAFQSYPFHIGITLRPALELSIGNYTHYPGTGYIYATIPLSELKF